MIVKEILFIVEILGFSFVVYKWKDIKKLFPADRADLTP
jgi:hypothetical protein